jgi:hypothetical protein
MLENQKKDQLRILLVQKLKCLYQRYLETVVAIDQTVEK